MLDPNIVAAVARLAGADLERDMRTLAVPRHHLRDPAGLAFVADEIERELSRAGYSVWRQDVTRDGKIVPNVVGERPGAEGDESVVIVCAHYDAVEDVPGADDNASAVAGMLAVARAAAAVPTKAALRFIAFAFEEEFLRGSSAYEESLTERERGQIIGVLDLEMIGFTAAEQLPGFPPLGAEPAQRGDFIAVVGLAELAAPLNGFRAAMPYVPDLPAMLLAVPRLEVMPDLMRSDHAPFWMAGIPAVMVTDTGPFRNPNYHRESDTIETIDFEFATSASRLVLAATLLLAGVAGDGSFAGTRSRPSGVLE